MAHFLDDQAQNLRRFCRQYWGKGDEGRRGIYKEMTVFVPPIIDDEVSGVCASNATEAEADLDSGDRRGSLPSTATEAEAQTDTSTPRGSLVTFTSASLGPGFEGFFPRYSRILVRKDYVDMLDHIKTIQQDSWQRGLVVTGQPGIGEAANPTFTKAP
jgi:hypothetical protein